MCWLSNCTVTPMAAHSAESPLWLTGGTTVTFGLCRVLIPPLGQPPSLAFFRRSLRLRVSEVAPLSSKAPGLADTPEERRLWALRL
jgi:hypothetical protein